MLSVHLVQEDFQKRKKSSVYQAGGKNRGKAFQKNSEQLKDDWERWITQSCLLSQDHGHLWNRSESSLYLEIPEFEP